MFKSYLYFDFRFEIFDRCKIKGRLTRCVSAVWGVRSRAVWRRRQCVRTLPFNERHPADVLLFLTADDGTGRC